jgi:hypothetical protein
MVRAAPVLLAPWSFAATRTAEPARNGIARVPGGLCGAAGFAGFSPALEAPGARDFAAIAKQ